MKKQAPLSEISGIGVAGSSLSQSDSLWTISRAMKDERAVFIVGCPRSGSTLLYKVLQKHSQFAPFTENLSEAEFFHFSNSTHIFKSDFPSVMPAYLGSLAAWTEYLGKIGPIRFLHKIARLPAIIRMSSRNLQAWRIFLNHTASRCFYFYALRSRGGQRVLEKTNYYLHHIPKIMTAFPKARLLAIHRHPLDTYTSYLRRGQIEQGAWLQKTPEQFCSLYRKNMLTLAANTDVVMPVSYERFTSEPAEEFERICRYINAPFEPTALVEDRPSPADFEPDPHLFGAIVKKTKNWQDYISKEQAIAIEVQLEDVMKDFGYHRYT